MAKYQRCPESTLPAGLVPWYGNGVSKSHAATMHEGLGRATEGDNAVVVESWKFVTQGMEMSCRI
jgi:hypothetical protein